MTILLFRSEDHVDRWSDEENMPRGEILSLQQAWQLAHAWYHDRSDPAWRRKTAAEARAVFREIGLTSPFWQEF